MNIFYKRSVLVILIMLTGAYAFAQNSKVAALDKYFEEARQSGLFNGNVLVADGGKIIFRKAVGYADASKQVMLNTDYRFHIGSIAKEFDAVGIMMLQQQGKLSIEDKVSKFFPDLPAWAQKISIKNLLQYASGLPEVRYKMVKSDADNWKDLYALQQLNFEPGTQYAYNNNNTFLRRRIIEKVTGISFIEFVKQNMFKPIGIKNGLFDYTDHDLSVAKSFDKDFKQDGLEVPISGWTCLTVDGLYKWSKCIANFCLLNPVSTREIITPIEPGKQCGLGKGSMQGNKVLTQTHDGSAMHYRALTSTDVPKGRSIIILCNQRPEDIYNIAAAITAILDGKPDQSR